MPEFAEVNVQVRWLRERCRNFQITGYGSSARNHFKNLPEAGRKKKLDAFFDGNTIEEITQRGKHVVLRTLNGTIASHLMFKGRWTMEGDDFTSNYKGHKKPALPKSNSFWVENDKGEKLYFNDPEYMGYVTVFPTASPGDVPALSKLGPEVLITDQTDPDYQKTWTLADLQKRTGRSKKAIKGLLLDQDKQSGLGNMYVCEALYKAKIDPNRPSNSLSEDEVKRVHEEAQKVVQKSIDTDLDYDKVLLVYRRETDPGGHAVKCSKVSGRDTFWVPDVQK